jgi:cellulose synthase/poly-beta-1,6-N-acetylglucosamine synthase-like glycosyltransferase
MSGAQRAGVVSTIIPVYNRASLLTEAVNSVLAQSYPLNEVIIVDDGSTDETVAVAESYAARYPSTVRYLRLDRGREWRARNHGLEIATGEFIQFLDSDDLIAPEKLATQVAGLRAHPECGISYCYVREYAIGDPPPQQPARRTGDTFATLFPALMRGRIWPYPSPLFRRSVIDAAGGGFVNRSAYPDWELECRMAANGVRLHHCRMFLAETRNTHRLEGRRKSTKPPETLRDVALVFELILGHARRSGVPSSEMQSFAARLFGIGRQCASMGLQPEAERSLSLAVDVSAGPRRALMQGYALVSRLLGWRLVGSAAERVSEWQKRVWVPASRVIERWRHRVSVGFNEVADRPFVSWPKHLTALWLNRPSRQLRR